MTPLRRLLAVLATVALAACARPGAAAHAAADAFLAKNATAEGVKTTPSGLQYRVIKSGPADGQSPRPEDSVTVNYEGTLLNGQVFDSTYQRGEPAVLGVGQLIAGWTEALQLMRPGDTWMLYVPPALGYGDEATGPIPAGSVLVFKLELINVVKN